MGHGGGVMIFVLAAAPFAVIGVALVLFTVLTMRSPRGLAAPPRQRGARPRSDAVRARSGIAPARPAPPPRGESTLGAAMARRASQAPAVVRTRVAPAVAALGPAVSPLAQRARTTAARASQSWPR